MPSVLNILSDNNFAFICWLNENEALYQHRGNRSLMYIRYHPEQSLDQPIGYPVSVIDRTLGGELLMPQSFELAVKTIADKAWQRI